MAMADIRQEIGALLVHGDADRILPVREHHRPTASADQGPHLRDGGSGPHSVAGTPAEVVNPALLNSMKG